MSGVKMASLIGRILVSAGLAGVLNVVLVVVSIAGAQRDAETHIGKAARILGVPAALLVQVVTGEGHGGTQVALLLVFSFLFYWGVFWMVLTVLGLRFGRSASQPED
jgi:hypothetical protein